MPRGDRTGPEGAGPMTGRGAGYCAGYSLPGYANPAGGYGRGLGRGRGYGRGWRRGFGRGRFVYPAPVVQPVSVPVNQSMPQPQSPEQEIAALENYQQNLEAEKADLDQEMGGIKARIEDLKAKLEK
ncbi:MAG: DUF5320 domain-containing protein [Candidatus Bathyarchaeota archaeon]|nr:DUF5320 domain-containing protein [Candidatus Bathyarchaeum tardum]WGM88628.1 MAG: DUF5320 domain-containing protein [Candidatus Bathyarchaeum tardum]WNZ29116.1 MAG: DUF5320 domain-containing protein [Candidatus Bathyarchaeota archaeon]